MKSDGRLILAAAESTSANRERVPDSANERSDDLAVCGGGRTEVGEGTEEHSERRGEGSEHREGVRDGRRQRFKVCGIAATCYIKTNDVDACSPTFSGLWLGHARILSLPIGQVSAHSTLALIILLFIVHVLLISLARCHCSSPFLRFLSHFVSVNSVYSGRYIKTRG